LLNYQQYHSKKAFNLSIVLLFLENIIENCLEQYFLSFLIGENFIILKRVRYLKKKGLIKFRENVFQIYTKNTRFHKKHCYPKMQMNITHLFFIITTSYDDTIITIKKCCS